MIKYCFKLKKTSRYIGNEVNSVVKDPEKVDIRFAMCFPDVYEIGMSYLGIQIIYDILNQREDTYCESVFSVDGFGRHYAGKGYPFVCPGIHKTPSGILTSWELQSI